ncbi:type IV secretion system protein [Neoehrlichia mikurensis]|uniref:type IV secretion system protein n=1 Tax=Neoehrlichia mikurensis TaxID=89586 RepID=UPI001C44C091|nr:type IV secretion system protein [Neoehrlichia mikurensis]QXK93076.1 type IV secretion system protein [Neoehrlichia mikurensis]QXK93556.1 type IV secretion system protein [Neoehrlichia mikurensis]
MQKIILLLLILLLTGCGVNCIEKGQGFSSSSIEVKVYVPPKGADRHNAATYWVNTGKKVSASDKIVLNVMNTINLCPYDTHEAKKVDFSVYKTAQPNAITSINTSEGDYLRFSLGSTDIEIKECSKEWLDSRKIIYYSDDEFFQDQECKTPILAKDICNNGISKPYFIKVEGECQVINTTIPRLKGTTIKIYSDNRILNASNSNKYANFYIDNGSGNKLSPTINGDNMKIKRYPNWIISKYAYDARSFSTKKPPLSELKKSCNLLKGKYHEFMMKNYNTYESVFSQSSSKDKSSMGIVDDYDYVKKYDQAINKITTNNGLMKLSSERTGNSVIDDTDYQTIINIMNNYTGYDINCNCDMICKLSDSLADDCVKSFVKIVKDKVICPTTEEDIISNFDENSATGHFDINDSYEILEGLKVRVTGDAQPLSLFQDTKIRDASLKLNTNIKVDTILPYYLHANMWVSRNSLADMAIGNYTVFWNRICTVESGKKLFMYIGDTPPKYFPGLSYGNEKHFELDTNKTITQGIYEINVDNPPESGTVYLGVQIDDFYDDQFREPKYLEDNYYSVRLFFSTWEPHLSNLFSKIKGALLYILYGVDGNNIDDIPLAIQNAKKLNKFGAIQHIYSHHTQSGSLWGAVQALITLYIMFSVFGYLIGVIRITKYDLVIRITKMVVILALFSQNSWEFFSEHFFTLFITGVVDIIGAFNGYLDGDSSFKFLDSTMGVLLTGETWLRFLSLIVAGPVGWMIFICIVWACVSFFICIIEAMIMYLFSIVAIAFLITLAPLFFTFLLFQFTKTLFDAWIKMLVNFSLQPIILFAALAFLNQVLLTSLYKITDFSACNKCFYGIKFTVEDDQAPTDLCLLSFMLPVGYSNDLSINERIREDQSKSNIGFMGLPFELVSVLIFVIIGNAMRTFGRLSEAMAHSISGSISGISTSAHWAAQSLLSIVGLDQETQNVIRSARSMVNSNVGANFDIRSKSGDKSSSPDDDNKSTSDSKNKDSTSDEDVLTSGTRRDSVGSDEDVLTSGTRRDSVESDDDTLTSGTRRDSVGSENTGSIDDNGDVITRDSINNNDECSIKKELFKEDNNNLSELINDYEVELKSLSRSDDVNGIIADTDKDDKA